MRISYLEWSTSSVLSCMSLLILSAELHWVPCPRPQGEHSAEPRPSTLGMLAPHQKPTTKPLSNPLPLQNISVQLITASRIPRAHCLPASSHLFQSDNGNFTERMQIIHFFSLGFFSQFPLVNPCTDDQQEPYWFEFAFPHPSLFFSICTNRTLLAAVKPALHPMPLPNVWGSKQEGSSFLHKFSPWQIWLIHGWLCSKWWFRHKVLWSGGPSISDVWPREASLLARSEHGVHTLPHLPLPRTQAAALLAARGWVAVGAGAWEIKCSQSLGWESMGETDSENDTGLQLRAPCKGLIFN